MINNSNRNPEFRMERKIFRRANEQKSQIKVDRGVEHFSYVGDDNPLVVWTDGKHRGKSGLQSYLGAAAVGTFHIGIRSLPKIVTIIEYLLVTATRSVLHVVQRSNLALSLDVDLLRLNLSLHLFITRGKFS